MAASSDPPAETAKPDPTLPEPSTTSTTAGPDGSESSQPTTGSQGQAQNHGPAADWEDAGGAACEIPEDDEVNPAEFQGEVLTNNDLPSVETQRKIENYMVLDSHGKTHTFKSLYTGRNVARRVLIIFVRHFYCGNCQEYLRSLSASITPESLLGLPISTFIAVIGCGDPALIDMYASATGCQFPIYADPTRKLYSELGMIKTLALGTRPAYMKKGLMKSSVESIVQGLKQLRTGLALKGGDQRQIGGEFLFEPLGILTPAHELERTLGDALGARQGAAVDDSIDGVEDGDAVGVEEKRVTWCHRMRSTRDHAEIPELMEVLGLDGEGQPIKDRKRWSKALQTRKGTGLSLASQMSQMSQKAESGALGVGKT